MLLLFKPLNTDLSHMPFYYNGIYLYMFHMMTTTLHLPVALLQATATLAMMLIVFILKIIIYL